MEARLGRVGPLHWRRRSAWRPGTSWGTCRRYPGYSSGKVASRRPSSMWILTSKQDEPDRDEHDPAAHPAEQRGARQHAQQAAVDRVARHRVWPVGAEPAIATDPGRHAPHRAEREAGPQREDGRGDEHGEPEYPYPGDADRGVLVQERLAEDGDDRTGDDRTEEHRRRGLAADPSARYAQRRCIAHRRPIRARPCPSTRHCR